MQLDSGSDKSLNIVLIDDDQHVLHVHHNLIQRLGHSVVSFTDPVCAISYIKDHKNLIDLIITDHQMPLLTGSQLLADIQAAGIALPAIILSGYPDEVRITDPSTLIISKPVRMNELKGYIRECVSNSPAVMH